MKAFVSGAQGFIGRHLVTLLQDENIEVSAPTRKELDITARKDVLDYFKDHEFDYIFHLAAGATQGGHKGDFRDIYETNVTGTVNLIEGANQGHYKAFINVGSSSEYGSHKISPMSEDDLPDPEFAYAGTKGATTLLLQSIAREQGRPIVTVRPFSIYGKGESEKRFIPTIIRCCKTDEVLNLAPGVHDWTHVEDVALGLLKVAEKAQKLSGEILNFGTGRQLTNKETVNILSEGMQKTLNINETPIIRSWDMQQVWANGSKKANNLGIYFRSFEEGIKDL